MRRAEQHGPSVTHVPRLGCNTRAKAHLQVIRQRHGLPFHGICNCGSCSVFFLKRSFQLCLQVLFPACPGCDVTDAQLIQHRKRKSHGSHMRISAMSAPVGWPPACTPHFCSAPLSWPGLSSAATMCAIMIHRSLCTCVPVTLRLGPAGCMTRRHCRWYAHGMVSRFVLQGDPVDDKRLQHVAQGVPCQVQRWHSDLSQILYATQLSHSPACSFSADIPAGFRSTGAGLRVIAVSSSSSSSSVSRRLRLFFPFVGILTRYRLPGRCAAQELSPPGVLQAQAHESVTNTEGTQRKSTPAEFCFGMSMARIILPEVAGARSENAPSRVAVQQAGAHALALSRALASFAATYRSRSSRTAPCKALAKLSSISKVA